MRHFTISDGRLFGLTGLLNETSSRSLCELVQPFESQSLVGVNWTSEEDHKLRDAVLHTGCKGWRAVSTLLKGRNERECRDRWAYFHKTTVKPFDYIREHNGAIGMLDLEDVLCEAIQDIRENYTKSPVKEHACTTPRTVPQKAKKSFFSKTRKEKRKRSIDFFSTGSEENRAQCAGMVSTFTKRLVAHVNYLPSKRRMKASICNRLLDQRGAVPTFQPINAMLASYKYLDML